MRLPSDHDDQTATRRPLPLFVSRDFAGLDLDDLDLPLHERFLTTPLVSVRLPVLPFLEPPLAGETLLTNSPS